MLQIYNKYEDICLNILVEHYGTKLRIWNYCKLSNIKTTQTKIMNMLSKSWWP